LPPINFLDDISLISDLGATEPYGWKIGIRDRDSKYAKDIEKQKQER
jgi:hypothetical protein